MLVFDVSTSIKALKVDFVSFFRLKKHSNDLIQIILVIIF